MQLPGRILAALAGAALVLGCLPNLVLQAHKPITSKYSYNADVFPIVRDRCGACHRPDGPAPMSLLTYQDAFPWAESIREELVTGRMPPGYLDEASPAIAGGHALTAREMDTLVVWASGGNPEGAGPSPAVPLNAHASWSGGQPDLVLPMTEDHTLEPGVMRDTYEFTLDTGLRDMRWVKAVDLLPGEPSIVRRARIAVDNGPVLALWSSDHSLVASPEGAAFRLPAGSRLRIRIEYRKPWQQERARVTDRSQIGLFFTKAASELQALVVQSSTKGEPGRELTAAATAASPITVIAVRPSLDQAYDRLSLSARLPDGTRTPLLVLRFARPDWPQRYWLKDPVSIPAGSTLEATAMATKFASDDRAPDAPESANLQVAVDFIAR